MNKKLLSLVQYIFFLGVGIFLLWLTLRKSDWSSINSDLRNANYIYIIPATLMLMAAHYVRAMRWRILIRPLGYQPSMLNVFLAVMVGYWANLAVPRLGEVLKCTFLARYEKVPADKLIGTIVAERAIDVCSLLVIMIITIAIQYEVIGEFSSSVFSRFLSAESGNFSLKNLAIGGGVAIATIMLVFWAGRKLRRSGFVIKIKKIFHGIWLGLISIRHIKNKGAFFLQSVLIWALYLFSTYMGFFAMTGMSVYGIEAAFSALTFGSFGMIIPSPGGIGSFQYAIQQVMLLYGASPEKGLALGMLIWIAQTGIIVIFGTLAFLLLPIVNRRKI